MFPIGDTETGRSGPDYVTYLLIVINVLVWLYEASLGQAAQGFINTFGAIPTEILKGVDIYTLVTSMFLHGGWLHIISNMLFLWVFGDNIEAAMGRIPYLLFYLAGGLIAALVHVMFNPASNIPIVGASGAIAALLGAYIIMFPRSQVRVLVGFGYITRVSAILFLGIWFVMQLFNGIASIGVSTAETSGVAVWAHVGGFVFGVLAGFLFKGRAQRLNYRTVR